MTSTLAFYEQQSAQAETDLQSARAEHAAAHRAFAEISERLTAEYEEADRKSEALARANNRAPAPLALPHEAAEYRQAVRRLERAETQVQSCRRHAADMAELVRWAQWRQQQP